MTNDFKIDFNAAEFNDQNKNLPWLCQTLKEQGYEIGVIDAPDNTIEWLNRILELPGFYEAVTVEQSSVNLTDELGKLKHETAQSRKRRFKDLSDEEQTSVKKLNRLMIELLHPKETPKCRYQLTAMIRTRQGDNFLQEYENIVAFKQDMNEHRSDVEWGLLVRSDEGKVIMDYFAELGSRAKIGLVETEPKNAGVTPEGLNPMQVALREAAVKHFKSNKAKKFISGQLEHVNSSRQLGEAIKFLFDDNGNPPPFAPIEDIIAERKKTEAKIEWLDAISSELKNVLTTLKEMEEGALELLGQDPRNR